MGAWRGAAARSAGRRARATQSSMVTSRTGTNGTTSVAPIRGCSPVCRERSIRSVATRMAASAASTLASGGATNVNTERLWAASDWTSSSLTPGTLVSARRSASMVAALRPSDEVGTHSARAPDAARGSHHGRELIEVASQERQTLERKSGADERLPRLGEPRDLERPLALPGAEFARAPIRPISRHIVHDADAQHATHQRPARHRVLRIPVETVGRAVEPPHATVVGCEPVALVFSGIQPSGELHIGNSLGAVQNWVKLQHQHDCLFCVVDLHAITQPYDAATLAQRTIDMAIGLFAAGID